MTRVASSSPNHEERRADVIDMLVLHYTGMETAKAALDRLRDPASKVSAHYLIDEDGATIALVPEERRAWHAGVSSWRGETDINSRSIGIELVNPGHDFGYRSFPDAQVEAVIDLAQRILSRHPIPPRNVVAHSDIAPTRRRDPGELFPWLRLRDYGIGFWPFDGSELAELPTAELTGLLADYGYDIDDPTAAISAFQRHFRPQDVTGESDMETAGRLLKLLRLT